MPRRKFGPEWKPENWKELAGSDFRFWSSVVSQKCYPKEMLSRRKISKWEITGWERLSLLEFCCFSKLVTIKNFPEWKSASGKDLAGSGFRFWKCAVSQTLLSDRNLVPNETPQVGTSGLVATFVSWILRFLKKMWPGGNLLPKENPKVETSGLVTTFVSGVLRFLKKCAPNEICSLKKTRTWERAGWERLSFLEPWGFSKM